MFVCSCLMWCCVCFFFGLLFLCFFFFCLKNSITCCAWRGRSPSLPTDCQLGPHKAHNANNILNLASLLCCASSSQVRSYSSRCLFHSCLLSVLPSPLLCSSSPSTNTLLCLLCCYCLHRLQHLVAGVVTLSTACTAPS